jgi:heme/copper-type cytochrome/quinol oxidase subunit 2
MFGLEMLRINFAFMALIGGAVGVIATILTYWMIWSPRTDPQGEQHAHSWWHMFKQIPWIIYLTIFGVIVYSIYHLIAIVRQPPNW